MEIHRCQKVLIPEAPNYLHENRDVCCWNFALYWLKKIRTYSRSAVAVPGRRKIVLTDNLFWLLLVPRVKLRDRSQIKFGHLHILSYTDSLFTYHPIRAYFVGRAARSVVKKNINSEYVNNK